VARGAGSGYAYAMRRGIAVPIRLVAILAVIGIVVAAPLVMVYRSTDCRGRGDDVRYSVVAPWDDPEVDCREHERGLDLLRTELGLD
jgi:hypothetical protein